MMAAEGSDFEPVVRHYREILAFLNWKDIGQILAGGVVAPGDIDGNPVLDEARKVGASIRQTHSIFLYRAYAEGCR